MAITVETRTQIVELTVGMVGAAPGAAILSELAEAVDAGLSIKDLAIAIANNPAFKLLYPSFLTNTEFATNYLTKLMGAEVTAEYLQGSIDVMVADLNAGTHRGEAMYTAISTLSAIAETDANYGAAAAALNNKTEVAVHYSVTTQQSADTLDELVAVVASVDSTQASVDAALAVVNGEAAAGKTFTLTTGTDQGAAFTGSTGNDTYSGIAAAGAATETLNASDILDGGAGSDVLNVVVTAAGDTLSGAFISNIETINVRPVGVAATIDASSAVGVSAINSNQGTGALTVTNVPTDGSVGINGNGTVVNGNLDFTYATASKPVTINLSNGTKSTTTVTNNSATTTTATINSTGATNSIGATDLSAGAGTITALTINATTKLTATLVAADYAATAKLTATGAGAVSVGATGSFKTIDASGNSGGLTATLNTITTSLKGSTGADTITTAGVGALTAGSLDGGDGTDTLVVAATTDVDTAAERAAYTSFETLSNGAGASIAASGFAGVTSVITSSDGGGFTGLDAAQAASISLKTDQTGGLTYALTTATGTADVLGLVSSSTLGTSVIDAAALTVDGFETLNLTTNTGGSSVYSATTGLALATTTYGNYGFTSAANLKTITVGGAKASLVDISANAVKVTTLNASGSTGGVNLSVGGQTGTVVVTGSAARDTIALAAAGAGGLQNVNAGAGADSITAAQAVIAVATINGGADSDTLTVSDAGTVTINDNNFAGVSSIEKIALGAVTGLTYSIGGFANSLATANGGVLEVAAAALDTTAAVTVDATGLTAGNSLKLTLTNADAASADAITITMSQGADVITVKTGGVGADTLTISGGVAALASTAVKTIDLSTLAASGAISVTTGAGDDVVKAAAVAGTYVLGGGADTFTGGAGADTVTGGSGIDTLTGAAGADVFVRTDVDTDVDTTAGAVTDIITDFVTASDTLDYDVAGTGANYVEQLTAATDLATLLAAADVALNGTVQYYFGVVGTNGYLVHDVDGIGYSSVLQLTGVTNIAETDIV